MLALGVGLASSALSQQAPATPRQQESSRGEQSPQPPVGNTIRTQAIEVLAPVVATDKKGRLVLDLTERDFRIFDEGVKEPIEHFGIGSEQLAIVLLLERSARVSPLFPDIRKSGIVFAQPVKGQTGEAAILEYDSGVRTVQEFTADSERLEKAIEDLQVGDDGANLYDAMRAAISLLETRPVGQRRVLLVIGESLDTGSESKLGEVLRQAEVANITIYSVGLSTTAAAWRTPSPKAAGPKDLPPLETGNTREMDVERKMQSGADLTGLAVWLVQTGKTAIGPNALAVACKSTGGLDVPSKNGPTMEEALDSIGGELHAQYTIGYTPSVDKAVGYHPIKVTVDRSGVVLRTRPGYYIIPPSH
jgi:VWFA-related protein